MPFELMPEMNPSKRGKLQSMRRPRATGVKPEKGDQDGAKDRHTKAAQR